MYPRVFIWFVFLPPKEFSSTYLGIQVQGQCLLSVSHFCLHFLKGIFIWFRIQGWWGFFFFPFSSLKTPSQRFLLCITSDSLYFLIFVPFHMVCLVSLTSFKIFSFITGFQQLDHAVSWHGFLCDYPVGMCWESWIDGFIVLIKFRNFSDFLQWKMFLGTTTTYVIC